ncbi:MAG: AI-2E family transporter [Elusimicrobia bacterium]|nr:AI-2E family transporter [Elusimicrobiota bacterium]
MAPLVARRPSPERQRLVQYFFFGTLLVLLYQSARLLAAFYIPLLAAGLLAMSVYPLHRRVRRAMPRRPGAAAALSAAATVLAIVLPLAALGWVFFREASKVAPVARDWLDGLRGWQPDRAPALPPAAQRLWDRGQALLTLWDIRPREVLLANLDALGSHAGELAGILLRNLLMVAVDFAALVFSLFLFLRNGPGLLRRLTELVPMAPEHKATLGDRVLDTVLAVVHGVLGVALLQGVLTGIGLALFHVPFPVLLGALTALSGPIPIIGVGAVLGPVVVCLYASGLVAQAWKVLLWSVVVVGGVDNILRPILISARAKLPLWLLFFGILGGLHLYGFTGLLIGPVLVALALAFSNIYRQEYAALLQGRPPGAEQQENRK